MTYRKVSSVVRRWPWAAGLAIFATAFALRFIHIGSSSFWQDEILQLRRTVLSLQEVWTYSPKNKPPLDYFIQALIVGERPNEWLARLHACLFGAAFVTIFTGWAWKARGPGFAAIAFLLSVASPILVRFSQEGRPYSLMLMAEAIFLGVLFYPAGEFRKTRGWWAAFFAAVALCVWAHYSLLLACIAAVIPVLLIGSKDGSDELPGRPPSSGLSKKASVRFILVCAGVFALLIAPLAGRGSRALRGQVGWATSDKTEVAFQPENVTNYMDVLAWGYDSEQTLPFSGFIFLGLIVLGFGTAIRNGQRRVGWGCAAAFVTVYAGTILLFYLLDRWIKVRYVLAALPPGLFLAATGVHGAGAWISRRLNPFQPGTRALNIGVLIALGIGLAQTGYVLTNPVQRDDWREVVTRVETKRDDSTLLVVSDWHSIGVLGYYLEMFDLPIPFRGIFFDASKLKTQAQSERDVWVFATHEDWWNIDRGSISRFLTEYVQMPQDLPEIWGVEIRRNRTPEEIVRDRDLKPVEAAAGERGRLRLSLEGTGSSYLYGGWFTSHEWAEPYYRQKLMADGATILLPVERRAPLELRARLRLRGVPRSTLRLAIKVNGATHGEWRPTESWEVYSMLLPEDVLREGLNALEFDASEALRIPVAEAGDPEPGPSVEVKAMELWIGGEERRSGKSPSGLGGQ